MPEMVKQEYSAKAFGVRHRLYASKGSCLGVTGELVEGYETF